MMRPQNPILVKQKMETASEFRLRVQVLGREGRHKYLGPHNRIVGSIPRVPTYHQ